MFFVFGLVWFHRSCSAGCSARLCVDAVPGWGLTRCVHTTLLPYLPPPSRLVFAPPPPPRLHGSPSRMPWELEESAHACNDAFFAPPFLCSFFFGGGVFSSDSQAGIVMPVREGRGAGAELERATVRRAWGDGLTLMVMGSGRLMTCVSTKMSAAAIVSSC